MRKGGHKLMRFLRATTDVKSATTGGKSAATSSEKPATAVNDASDNSAPSPAVSAGIDDQGHQAGAPAHPPLQAPSSKVPAEQTPRDDAATAGEPACAQDEKPPTSRDREVTTGAEVEDGRDAAATTALSDGSTPPSGAGAGAAPASANGATPGPALDADQQAEKLWHNAYDLLRGEDPGLIHAYETMIAAYETGKGRSGNRRRSFWASSNEAALEDATLPLDPSSRREWTESVADRWLGEQSQEGDRGTEANGIRSLRGIMGAAVRVYPQASLAWVASWLALENLLQAPSAAPGTRAGVLAVVSRIEWYSRLPGLILRDSTLGEDADVDRHVEALTFLYKAILGHLIDISLNGQRAEAADATAANQIRDCEMAFATGLAKKQGIESELSGLFERPKPLKPDATPPDSEPSETAELERLLERLGVAEQPVDEPETVMGEAGRRLYNWARGTSQFEAFTKWGHETGGSVLWVSGMPGAGKSMLLHAAAQALLSEQESASANDEKRVAYFFCNEGAGFRQRDARSAVASLISCILRSQRHLLHHLESAFQDTKRDSFEGTGDFYVLSTVLYSIISDPGFAPTYFVVDSIELLAFDVADIAGLAFGPPEALANQEQKPDLNADFDGIRCRQGLADLVSLVSATAAPPYGHKVKWLVSVDSGRFHGLPAARTESHLHLDMDSYPEAIRKVVSECIAPRLGAIATPGLHRGNLYAAVLDKLHEVTPASFIWLDAALSVVKLTDKPWNLPDILDEMGEKNPDVNSLYSSATERITSFSLRDKAYCTQILSTVACAYRPLPVVELAGLIELRKEVDLSVIVDTMLYVFLEIRDDKLGFKRLSARDFIRRNMASLGLDGFGEGHSRMAHRCLRVVLDHLSGSQIPRQRTPPTPLESYICTYAATAWIRHLTEPGVAERIEDLVPVLELAAELLQDHLLEWLEMLNWQDELSDIILRPMAKLLEVAAASASSLGPSDNSGKPSLERMIPDIMKFMQFVLGQVREDSDADEGPSADQEVAAADGGDSIAQLSARRLRSRLLFASTADTLRQKLMPKYYPWLIGRPRVRVKGNQATSEFLVVRTIRHNDWVRECCFSPDGRRIASVSDDGRVRLWDVGTGRLQWARENAHGSGYVLGVAMCSSSPGGHPIIAAYRADNITLWDARTGRPWKSLSAIADDSGSMEQTDGARGSNSQGTNDEGEGDDQAQGISAGNPDSTVHTNFGGTAVHAFAIAPGGDRLAAVVDGKARLWKSTSPASTEVALAGGADKIGEEGGTRCICFSPDGLYMVFNQGNKIVICDSTTGGLVRRLPECISPLDHGQQNGTNGDTELEDTEEKEGEGDTEPGDEKPGDTEPEDTENEKGTEDDQGLTGRTEYIIKLVFSQDSSLLMSTHANGWATIWDWRSWERLAELEYKGNNLGAAALSWDGTKAAMGYTNGMIAIWAQTSADGWSTTGQRSQQPQLLAGHHDWIRSLHFSPTGNLLASSSDDGRLRIWDLDMAEHVDAADGAQPAFDSLGEASGEDLSSGHSVSICYVSVSTDGEIIASASIDGRICLWNGSTGEVLSRGQHPNVISTAFSPDSDRLISVSKDQTALIWKLESTDADAGATTMTPEHRLVGHLDWVRTGVFSPDGRRVATASDDYKVRLWDISAAPKPIGEGQGVPTNVPSKEEIRDAKVPVDVFTSHSDYVYCLAFSPDGERLASAGDDRRVMIWDRIKGRKGDRGGPDKNMKDGRVMYYIRALVFSPDGTRLFSVSRNGALAIWRPDLPEGEQLVVVVASYDEESRWFRTLNWDNEHKNVLLTALGAWPFDISDRAVEKAAADFAADDAGNPKPLPARPLPPTWAPFTIGGRGLEWISCNGHKLISLPPRYRPSDASGLTCLVQGQSVVVGCDSGEVLLFRFSEDMLRAGAITPLL